LGTRVPSYRPADQPSGSDTPQRARRLSIGPPVFAPSSPRSRAATAALLPPMPSIDSEYHLCTSRHDSGCFHPDPGHGAPRSTTPARRGYPLLTSLNLYTRAARSVTSTARSQSQTFTSAAWGKSGSHPSKLGSHRAGWCPDKRRLRKPAPRLDDDGMRPDSQ